MEQNELQTKLNQLYAMKGLITTELEIGNQKLQRINADISNILNAQAKPQQNPVIPKKVEKKSETPKVEEKK